MERQLCLCGGERSEGTRGGDEDPFVQIDGVQGPETKDQRHDSPKGGLRADDYEEGPKGERSIRSGDRIGETQGRFGETV